MRISGPPAILAQRQMSDISALSTPRKPSSATYEAEKADAKQTIGKIDIDIAVVVAKITAIDTEIAENRAKITPLVDIVRNAHQQAQYDYYHGQLTALQTYRTQLANDKAALSTRRQTQEDIILALAKKLSPRKPTSMVDEKLDPFWFEIKTVDVDAGDVLRLPSSSWWNNQAIGREIYVRKCYRQLLALIDTDIVQSLNQPVTQPVMITGTPGIGKSMFGYWLVAVYLQRPDVGKVIYAYCVNETAVYYHLDPSSPHIFSGVSATINDDLDRRDVVLIIDGILPPTASHQCRIIFVTSPKRELINKFVKVHPSAKRLYMPIWDWDEIKRCRQLQVFVKLDEQKVQQFFRVWGGIPRFVLAGFTNAVRNFEDVLSRSSPQDLITSVGAVASKPDVSDRLAMMHVIDDTFENIEIRLTEYAQSCILNLLLQSYQQDQNLMVLTAQPNTATAALFGYVYEQVMHRRINRGATTRIRSLNAADPRTVYNIFIPARSMHRFDSSSSITKIPPNVYAIPTQSNLAVIDSIYFPKVFFQSTTALHHPIKGASLKKLLELVGLAASNAGDPAVILSTATDPTKATPSSAITAVDTLTPSPSKRHGEQPDTTQSEKKAKTEHSSSSSAAVTPLLPDFSASFNLVFVVPPHHFHEFTAQKYITTDKTDYVQVPPEFKDVKQWVMELTSTVADIGTTDAITHSAAG